jgi:hypothetical protein
MKIMADDAARGSDRRQERQGVPDTARQLVQRARRMRPSAALAIAVAAGFLVWLLFIRGDGNSPAKPAQGTNAAAGVVSSSDLLEAVKGVGYPVYWVGQEPGVGYTVNRSQPGQTLVRYLPAGENPATDISYLTVGSYHQANAYKNLEKLAVKPGSTGFEVAHGGLAYFERNAPTSVYVAFPDVPTQIEVYDPQKGQALKLVRSGAVSPIG